MSAATESDLVEVVLMDVPLDVRGRAQAHHDELVREFRLILTGQEGAETDVPRRLLTLIEDITQQYASFSAGLEIELEQANAAGEKTHTVRFSAPPSAYDFCVRLVDMLEESDRYCSEGQLLTLAPSEEALNYRHWYLGEVIRQMEGKDPTSWVDYLAQRDTAG